jgi:hypothetical protein
MAWRSKAVVCVEFEPAATGRAGSAGAAVFLSSSEADMPVGVIVWVATEVGWISERSAFRVEQAESIKKLAAKSREYRDRMIGLLRVSK